MRTFLTLSCLAVLLPACGGTEPGEDSGGAGTDPTTTTEIYTSLFVGSVRCV